MAVPFRRTSKTRKAKRRTHFKLAMPTIINCQQCGKPVKPHYVCKSCGYYKGREVIKLEE